MTEDPNGFNFDENENPPAKTSGNQGFILVVSILGGIFLIALIVMAFFVVVVMPRNQASQSTKAALVYQQNTATVKALTSVAGTNSNSASSLTQTARPTNTVESSQVFTATPLVAQANGTTNANQGSADSRTATVAALLTEAAAAASSGTPATATAVKTTGTSVVKGSTATATALPTTGFASDAGIPGLLILTVVLLAVIFVVRRMRSVSNAA